MSYRPQIVVLSITALMALVMGYGFQTNAFANNFNVDDNLPMIVHSINIGNSIPLNA